MSRRVRLNWLVSILLSVTCTAIHDYTRPEPRVNPNDYTFVQRNRAFYCLMDADIEDQEAERRCFRAAVRTDHCIAKAVSAGTDKLDAARNCTERLLK